MPFNPRHQFRLWHRWGAIVVAVPFLLVLVTGLLLQIKKQWTWVQPPTAKGSAKVPTTSMDAILKGAMSVPEAEISSWKDIDRLDVRPGRGVVKVQAVNRYEIQLDAATAEVLHVAYRRSDLIESFHDGSWFGEEAKLWVFLPAALVVLMLWATGIYLFALPLAVKWRRRGGPREAPAPPP